LALFIPAFYFSFPLQPVFPRRDEMKGEKDCVKPLPFLLRLAWGESVEQDLL
jgi:hypothetical protein